MREIALFVEDYAHQQIIGALVRRISVECNTAIRLDWRVAVGGHGKVITELNNYMRDLKQQGSPWPDLIRRCYRRQLQRIERTCAGGRCPR